MCAVEQTDWAEFDRFIGEAFQHGTLLRRELRLTAGERDYLQRRCSVSAVDALSPGGGGKTWFLVSVDRTCLR